MQTSSIPGDQLVLSNERTRKKKQNSYRMQYSDAGRRRISTKVVIKDAAAVVVKFNSSCVELVPKGEGLSARYCSIACTSCTYVRH